MEDMKDMEDKDIHTSSNKNISFSGTSTRYQMKKVLGKVKKEERVKTDIWEVPEEYYTYDKQIELLSSANKYTDLEKYIINEMSKKISGYKQQDQKNKKKTDNSHTKIKKNEVSEIVTDENNNKDTFVTIEYCFEELKKQNLLCCYCSSRMFYLYSIQREPRQWTLDRIDNDGEHTCDNVVFCCLDCNLKRRCKSKNSFEFTKQLTIIRK
jgi:hypothetical protein